MNNDTVGVLNSSCHPHPRLCGCSMYDSDFILTYILHFLSLKSFKEDACRSFLTSMCAEGICSAVKTAESAADILKDMPSIVRTDQWQTRNFELAGQYADG